MSDIIRATLIAKEEVKIQNQADVLVDTIINATFFYPVDIEEVFAYIRQEMERKASDE